MKTKLSYLALPLCWGVVLALVLAACSEDKNDSGGGGGTSSPSSEPYRLSSEVAGNDSVSIDGFGVDPESSRINITGTVYGTGVNPIVKVEFSPASYFSYESELVLPSPTVKLTGKVYIDLANPSLTQCGQFDITVKGCLDMACSPGKYATRNSKFERPASFCNSSSSEAMVSSSSEVMWVFGSATPIPDVPMGQSVSIGTGSFRLDGDEGQPNITVAGGTVRATGLGSMGEDDTPVAGKAYSSKENFLGSSVPTSSTYGNADEGVQNKDYLLIYFGSTVYLLRLEAKSGQPWPVAKQGTYWPATEHP